MSVEDGAGREGFAMAMRSKGQAEAQLAAVQDQESELFHAKIQAGWRSSVRRPGS